VNLSKVEPRTSSTAILLFPRDEERRLLKYSTAELSPGGVEATRSQGAARFRAVLPAFRSDPDEQSL